jgi:hypothetical protein
MSFLPLGDDEGEVCPHCGHTIAAKSAASKTAPEEAKGTGWYYSRKGVQAGPVSATELKKLASSGRLAPTDLVRKADSSKWVQAGKVRGLFPEENTAEPLPLTSDSHEEAPTLVAPPRRTTGAADRLARTRARSYELLIALLASALLTGGYLLLARNGPPRPSSTLGYTLGILGFLLMLCTETLYTLRKRARRFHFGRMSSWLQIHIITGIVGPCLVLLHAGGKFHGLAGILAALTIVIVLSGFIGRYIYTAVPRTLDGVELAVRDLEARIAEFDGEIQALDVDLEDTEALAIATETPQSGWLLVFGRAWARWQTRRRLRRALRPLKAAGIATRSLERLLMARYQLQVQIASLAMTRRMLALWHVLHIPLGAGVFTLAFVHIAGAIYYASFLK